ncbi:MAG: efflux RND transporter permease subunit [Planctomycetaceae bacterium]|jgi:multidrug efflux pump subunit AcrB|nr:efflux RND transporter permease subunit [Planctomycetaceae bacterium]
MLRRIIKLFVFNSPAMNILMLAVIVFGFFSGLILQRETFPNIDIDMITVTVPYPGATPEEVENGICQKIEEAIQSISGINKIYSTASEGSASVMIELRSDEKNPDRVLDNVKNAVDRVRIQFPDLAEPPVVQRAEFQEIIISIGLIGPLDYSVDAALQLRQVAENLRDELLNKSLISMVNLAGTKDYQIDIEIPESVLRSYHLTLDQAASIIRAENIQTPGGVIRAPSQEINVRTDNRRYDGYGIGKLPFITSRKGVVIPLEDVAYIRDEFVDGPSLATIYIPPETGIPTDYKSISGRPVIKLAVLRNTNEDLLAMVDQVHEFIREKNQPGGLPQGFSLVYWGDRSVEIRERLNLLAKNGIQGLIIVFILLALFLEIKLAFWVALGIPFSICTTGLWLFATDLTLNMISTFGVIMGLGIVVDDSIVVGENIYAHRKRGKNFLTAAIDGTVEVFPSVFASVLTTVIAFIPLLFVSGMMGKIVLLIPVVMITMLVSSICECMMVLPCHLAHRENLFLKMVAGYLYIFSWLLIPLRGVSLIANTGMEFAVKNIYAKSVVVVLRNRLTFIVGCICALSITLALIFTGRTPFVIFPDMDGNTINATLVFPNGTPEEVTDQWTRHIEQSFWKVAKEYENAGIPVAINSIRTVGTSLNARGANIAGISGGGGNGHQGGVEIELLDGNKRKVTSIEIVNRWREVTGAVPGADKLTFESQMFGPPGGDIAFDLIMRVEDADKLEKAVEETKEYLATIKGTQDINDGDMPGKYEFRLKIKKNAMAMGIHPDDLAKVIRATYYGAEVQRLQRGRHEVKVMVCYPREDRRSIGNFNEIRIRTANGEFPITELADIEIERGYTAIKRINQQRAIEVSADVDDSRANTQQIVAELEREFFPKLKEKYPGISIIWDGRQEDLSQARESMIIGFSIAMCAMFMILTIQFRSYMQPFIIMAIIPFGLIGSVIAHTIYGSPMTLFSLFGLVALSGIIVNDSIVMIDFINRKIRDSEPLTETLVSVGQRRFRPIFLTSVTTIGGLLPVVMETSFQAQMIIPMALSIAGGVMFTLILVLYFVPVLYSLYADLYPFQKDDMEIDTNNT